MKKEIKDLNQFTPEQEKMMGGFLVKQKQYVLSNELSNQRGEKILIDNGFIFGIDYINTFKIETVTREVILDIKNHCSYPINRSYWNINEFKAELTYRSYSGHLSLKTKRFHQGKLIDETCNVMFDNGKVCCYSIQGQYRYIKPSTILKKLKEYNSCQEILFEEHKGKNKGIKNLK
jgi:hypothetical protein